MTLREIVKKYLEEEILRNYYEEEYIQATLEEKEKILSLVNEEISRKTEIILSAFVEDIQRGSPERKKKKYLNAFLAFITLISSTGLAFAVNQENPSFIVITSLVILGSQIYQILSD